MHYAVMQLCENLWHWHLLTFELGQSVGWGGFSVYLKISGVFFGFAKVQAPKKWKLVNTFF
jgi:hypothetical protein